MFVISGDRKRLRSVAFFFGEEVGQERKSPQFTRGEHGVSVFC